MKSNKTTGADSVKSRKSVRSFFVTTVNVFETIGVFLFHFRKLLLALPVVAASLVLARINLEKLPEEVGVSLMANGQFAQTVSREVVIYGPMAVTGVCLVLMFCSRRALYPWLISVFTLVLPIFILITNIFPA